MSELAECPSGLKGRVRKLIGQELNILSDSSLVRSGRVTDEILKTCWVETIAPGPYTMGKDGKPDWRKVLVGDRTVASIEIRVETLGRYLPLKFSCGVADCAEDPPAWDLDLKDEIKIKPLSPQDLQRFIDGNRFEGRLEDGTAFWYRLPVGEDAGRFSHLTRRELEKSIIPLVASRVIEIDGVEPHMIRHYFDKAGGMVALDALVEMSLTDCGVDDEVLIECPHHFKAVTVPFPLGRIWEVDLKAMKERKMAERLAARLAAQEQTSSSGTTSTPS